MWGSHWASWFSSDGHIPSPNFVDIAIVAPGDGGDEGRMDDKRGWGATWETEKKEWVALPMSCTFNFFFPSRSSLVGCANLVQRWASFPPSPLGKLVPKSYPFELQWEAAFLWGLKTGIFGRLLEVPGHAFFTWCDVKLTFVWWFHT